MEFITQVETPRLYQRQGISSVAMVFDLQYFDKSVFNRLNIAFPDSLNKAVNKRRAEFLAGRYAAKLALESLGIFNFDIKTGDNRQPLWPEGVIGSITHTGDFACCAVAKKTNYQSLGLDIENSLTEKTANEIKKSIITQSEESVLEAYSNSVSHTCTLAFSAKESLFKALYHKVGQYFDFLDAELIHICTQNNMLTLKILKDLSKSIKQGMCFTCYFAIYNGNTHTFALESAR